MPTRNFLARDDTADVHPDLCSHAKPKHSIVITKADNMSHCCLKDNLLVDYLYF